MANSWKANTWEGTNGVRVVRRFIPLAHLWEDKILPQGKEGLQPAFRQKRVGRTFSAFAASSLPSAQNNFHVKEAYFGVRFWSLSIPQESAKTVESGCLWGGADGRVWTRSRDFSY